MIRLSKKTIGTISPANVNVPGEKLFQLPEKILQFGTGVLLRGLCDYIIHDANTKGIFNGRIVVVKSTDAGSADAFDEQDNLYTVCVRGMDKGNIVTENIICSAISRVLSAKNQWDEVLRLVHQPELNTIISNTTEVGLQLVKEKVTHIVPSSFPGKLLAVLMSRYKQFNGSEESRMVIVPTELLSDNGDKLRAIIFELAEYNGFEKEFFDWLDQKIIFCNSLVDRIVTKDPGDELLEKIHTELGYDDQLLTMCEDYRLWAIEGSPEVEKMLSFTSSENGAFVKPDIDIYKFLKLHLLNGTHTLSASLAYLAGFDIVKESMEGKDFASFVENLMLTDIARAIPYDIPEKEIRTFAAKVLDRFRNPFLQHKWINITLQNSMKMKNRNVPVILRYHELYGTAPKYMAAGFAGFLLFMKPVKKEGNIYFGKRGDEFYPINDDQAGWFYDVWRNENSPGRIVTAVLSNKELWGADLSIFKAFAISVEEKLTSVLTNDVRNTIKNI